MRERHLLKTFAVFEGACFNHLHTRWNENLHDICALELLCLDRSSPLWHDRLILSNHSLFLGHLVLNVFLSWECIFAYENIWRDSDIQLITAVKGVGAYTFELRTLLKSYFLETFAILERTF